MQKLITKLLLLALALLGVSSNAVAQKVVGLSPRFVESGFSSIFNVASGRVAFSRFSWVTIGGAVSCSVKVEESDDGITWSDFTSIQDCTSTGKLEIISSPPGFVRFNVTALTSGSDLRVFWDGFSGNECGFNYDGIFSVIISANPTAGAELLITVPTTERWRIYSSLFELQVNSVVGDREVFLVASEGSDEYFRVFADGVVKAGQKGIFTSAALGFVGTAGLGPSSINQPTDVRTILIPIYSETFVPGGHTVSTSTGGLQSGDDYSSATILVERCPN